MNARIASRVGRLCVLCVGLSLIAGRAASAQKTKSADKTPKSADNTAKAADNYDAVYAKYLEEARASAAKPPAGQAWAWMSGLALDSRARHVNDLITIDVVENITGAGTADSALAKDSTAGLAVTGLFGVEKKLPGTPGSLVAAKSNTDFKGSGTTSRTGQLTALVTARVVDVFPNGDLVVEGIHEIDINGDRQIVVLSGVVRLADVGPSNRVASTSVGELRIRYFGHGLMKDNLSPGWLVRVVNKIF